jgi:hypothetical protein
MCTAFHMDRKRLRVMSLYLDRALDTPTAQRDAWLRELESNEPRVGIELRRLLAAENTERFNSFLSGQALEPAPNAQPVPSGEIIGSYRVLHEIGRGGMALVADALEVIDVGDQQGRAVSAFAGRPNPAVAQLALDDKPGAGCRSLDGCRTVLIGLGGLR